MIDAPHELKIHRCRIIREGLLDTLPEVLGFFLTLSFVPLRASLITAKFPVNFARSRKIKGSHDRERDYEIYEMWDGKCVDSAKRTNTFRRSISSRVSRNSSRLRESLLEKIQFNR